MKNTIAIVCKGLFIKEIKDKYPPSEDNYSEFNDGEKITVSFFADKERSVSLFEFSEESLMLEIGLNGNEIKKEKLLEIGFSKISINSLIELKNKNYTFSIVELL